MRWVLWVTDRLRCRPSSCGEGSLAEGQPGLYPDATALFSGSSMRQVYKDSPRSETGSPGGGSYTFESKGTLTMGIRIQRRGTAVRRRTGITP